MSETLTTAMQAPATIRFNGRDLPVTHALTLADLLSTQSVSPEAMATAVNGRFVPRDVRGTTWLQAGDEVLTFQAIVGG